MSVANKIAANCRQDILYLVVTPHSMYKDSWLVRVFGVGTTGGKKMEGKLWGIWQLLSQDQVEELGLERQYTNLGGLILSRGHKKYHTTCALGKALSRMLGMDDKCEIVVL